MSPVYGVLVAFFLLLPPPRGVLTRLWCIHSPFHVRWPAGLYNVWTLYGHYVDMPWIVGLKPVEDRARRGGS